MSNKNNGKTYNFWEIANTVFEKLFLFFIFLGSFYPELNIERFSKFSEIFFLILLIGLMLYFKIASLFFPNKTRYSQDNVHLVQTAIYILFIISLSLLPVYFSHIYINANVPTNMRPPATNLEWIGYAVNLPALYATALYPYLRLTQLAEKRTIKNRVSLSLVAASMIIHLVSDNYYLLVGGYILSGLLPRVSKRS